MAEAVSHKGRIIAFNNESVSVEIVSESACASCHAAGLCGVSEIKKKIVDVPVRGATDYQIGQEVEVCLARKAGMKAVLVPSKNRRHVKELDKEITEGMEICYVDSMEEVIREAMITE